MDYSGLKLVGLCLLVAGCGSGGSTPAKKPADVPKKDEIAQRIGTGGIEVTSRDEKRTEVWQANAKKATVDIAKSGAIRAAMTGVSGTIFDEGKAAADFSADRGQADQASQELSLRENVELTEIVTVKSPGNQEDPPIVPGKIVGKTLDWLPTIKMIQVQGAVTFKGRGLRVGPLASVWVTPDMKQVGTPDSFKNDPKMKKLVAPLLASAAIVSAGTFADEKGNMQLSFKTWRATQVDTKTVKFSAAGSPVVGTWKSQGINFKGQTMDGTLTKQPDGSYSLASALLAGGVRTELTRKDKGVARTSVLTSDRANFVGNMKTGTLELNGGITVTSALSNSSQWMQLTGTSGTFRLNMASTTGQPLESADLSGPVTMRMISKRRNAAGAAENTDITATGRRLTFNSGAQEIELSGGVIVTGSGPAIIGRMEVSRVRITLDAQGFVKEVFAEGEPGQATVKGPN